MPWWPVLCRRMSSRVRMSLSCARAYPPRSVEATGGSRRGGGSSSGRWNLPATSDVEGAEGGSMAERTGREPIVVVGAGLAGLAAAALLGRAGRKVVVLERSPEVGGRGVTHTEQGFRWNLGAHALYRGGPGMAGLRDLGPKPAGGMPATAGGRRRME